MGDIVILASCEYHFIRVHENMVQHPSNNISIILHQIMLNIANLFLFSIKNFKCFISKYLTNEKKIDI